MNRGEEEAVSTAPDAGADGGSGSGSGDEAPMLRRTSKVSFPTTQPASSGDVHSPAHEKILSRKPTPFNQDLAATIKSSGITALLTGEAATAAAAAAGDTGAAASPANGDEGAAEDALREQDRGGTETVQEQVNGIGAEESGAAAPVEEE